MKHWFKDQHLRSLLKNSSYLAISRGVAAVCSLATVAFAGRGLGLILFGTLILITSYAKAASGISKFQSWQLIIRYGGQALHANQPEEFKTSTGFAFGLDAVSGVAGMLVAVALLPFVAQLIGIRHDVLWLAMLYCTLLPTMAAATPNGVLRALDRFDLLSWQGTTYPIARSLLVAIAYFSHAPFEAYVAIWYVTDLGGDLYLWFLAWRELRRRGLLEGIRPTLRPTTLPGAWRFAIHVNLTSSVAAIGGPVARLAVGGLLGPAATALFRVASSLVDSTQKPADMLAKAFYPEIVRMDLRTKRPWKLLFRTSVLATGIALIGILILFVGGKQLISLLFGRQFLGAYSALLVLMVIPLLGVLSFPMTPMLYALQRPDAPLKARILGTLTYFVVVAPLCWSLDLVGAAVAYALSNAMTVLVLILQLRAEHRRIRS